MKAGDASEDGFTVVVVGATVVVVLVEQSAPSYPVLHVQVHWVVLPPPLNPPTTPLAEHLTVPEVAAAVPVVATHAA